MNKAQRRYWKARAAGQLGGYGSYGDGVKATLKIGRKAGLTYSGWREGDTIPASVVDTVVEGLRAGQVGRGNTGLTSTAAVGRYKGQKEPSVSVELVWTGAPKEQTKAAFFRNVKKLAQDVAGGLAQREVIVEWSAPGRRGRVDTATPSKAPSALSSRFCSWVRQHSMSAQKNPRDACYVKKGK